MKPRKFFALLLALTLLLTACGSAEKETTPTQTTETTAQPQETVQTDPPAEVKPIRAILTYTHHAFSAQNGAYGYYFDYFTPTQIVTGQTKNTPIDLDNPLNTPDIDNMAVRQIGAGFETLCEDLWAMRFDLLPASIEVDYDNFLHDGSNQYIVIYFEDGTTFDSGGYCAPMYSEQFNAVWDRLRLFRVSMGVS